MFGTKPDDKLAKRLQAIKLARPIRVAEQKPMLERIAVRHPTYKFGVIRDAAGNKINCIVKNLSSSGAKLTLEGAIALPATVDLKIDEFVAPTTAKLVWQNGCDVGIQFT